MRSRKRRDGGRTSIHLLAEIRRHLALVQRGHRREPGQDNRIVNEALAAHCTDITEARTERGEEPGYRLYTARWAPTDPPPSRTRAAAPRWDRKPAADPAAPFLPLEPGEWDIPRVPLRHDRAVIAARVLIARLRTVRRTGRPLYGPAAHQPTAPNKQLLLFAQEQPPTAARPAVDLATLRTDLEALELTADQIRRIGTAFATVGDEARRRVRKPAPTRTRSLRTRTWVARRARTTRRAEDAPPAPAPHRPGPRRARMMRSSTVSAHRRCRASTRCTSGGGTATGWGHRSHGPGETQVGPGFCSPVMQAPGLSRV
ncbi:hypothetical protein [Streptomyces coeruleorubidus]|uniref:hypothetical protein n=1 Tax=Streptomyces coeruleorubidus TaxID=116188 RepID=UPI0033AC951E